MRVLGLLARNRGFLIACAIAVWLGIELGGKGTGVVRWLFSPAPVRDGGFHPVDIVAPRPKGPARLTEAEAAAVDARLAKAFAGSVPKHVRILAPHLRIFRTRDDPGCGWSGRTGECKQVEYTEPFLGAVLGAMHAETEHLLLLEVKSYEQRWRDERIRLAVFVGSDARVKLAFDLRRIKGLGNFTTFTVKASDMVERPALPAREVGSGILVVDDPGPLQWPKKSAGSASILVYGGTSPPENGILTLQDEGDFHVRHKFFSAVLGKLVQGVDAGKVGPAYAAEFEPRLEDFRLMAGVGLRQALIDAMGGSRAATARFSDVVAIAGRGAFHGVVIGGERYLAVQITDAPGNRDYEFFWDGPEGLKAVADVATAAQKYKAGSAGGSYYLIPISGAGRAERLVVFRRVERGAAIAGLWPLAEWGRKMDPLVEADPKALGDAGIGMDIVRRAAAGDPWLASCARFLEAYPSFTVKTGFDEWRRAACVRNLTEAKR